MREFNTLGPVYADRHYHVNRLAVKAELRNRIDKGRYLTLNASRQTGKTTLFREVIEELAYALARWRELNQPMAPEPAPMRHHGDFLRWLRSCVRLLGKKGMLIIDKFDSVATNIMEPMLSLFRGMYLEKYEPQSDSLHSMILVGVRNLPSLLGHSYIAIWSTVYLIIFDEKLEQNPL